MRRNEAILLDILQAAKTARKFKGKISKKEFLQDELVQSAILHQLIVVGEAVKYQDGWRLDFQKVIAKVL